MRKLILSLIACLSGFTFSEILLSDSFETSKLSANPNPVLSWPPPYSRSERYGMPYGPGEIYDISSDISLVGDKSLRLDFSGRNGKCQKCGYDTIRPSSSEASSGCFSMPDVGPWGEVYNVSNGHSEWSITSQTPTQVCVNPSSASSPSTFINHVVSDHIENNSIQANDELFVTRVCGVNGNTGFNDFSRIDDCNEAINYIRGIENIDINYGESIARRFYIYIPQETVMPQVTFKLGYTDFELNGNRRGFITVISTQRESQVEVQSFNGYHGANINVPRNSWFYIEELFTRESGAGSSDGTYQLFAYSADDPDGSPRIELNNIEFGELKDMTIVGNFQSSQASQGYVYFDEIAIKKNGLSGPLNQPKSPLDATYHEN